MDKNYLTQEMGLEIVRPVFSTGDTTNDHHVIRCQLCSHEFEATPKSKKQNFKKWGSAGCPLCTQKRRHGGYEVEVKKQLEEMGFKLLGEFKHGKVDLLICNTNCCSRPFKARTNNIISGKTICPPCNNDVKRQRMAKYNLESHEEALQYREPFDAYRKRVRVLSEASYREHYQTINPNDYPRGRHEDYHLDHIKSISECFHADIPPEECAHYRNLQMLPWDENISKGGSNRNV